MMLLVIKPKVAGNLEWTCITPASTPVPVTNRFTVTVRLRQLESPVSVRQGGVPSRRAGGALNI